MKVAVAIFKDVVAPRLDIADSVIIYEIKNKVLKSKEKFRLFFDRPYYLIALMEEEKLTSILCGSCPPFLLRALDVHDFDVKWGLMGDPDKLIKSLIEGKYKNLKIGNPLKSKRNIKK